MDKFEKLIKDAVEGYEAPFNPQAWENVSQGLNQTKPLKWIIGGAAAALVIVSSVVAVNYAGSDEVVDNDNANLELVDNSLAGNLDNIEINNTTSLNNQELSNEGVVDANEEEIITVPVVNHDGQVNNSGNATAEAPVNNTGHNTGNSVNHSNGTLNHTSANTAENPVNENEVVVHYSSEFSIVENSICMNESVVCVANEMHSEVIYVWDMGDGTISTGIDAKHEYKEAGDYKITLSLKDKKTNKTVSKSSNIIEVKALPKTDFAWETTSKIIPTVRFINLTEDGESFSWNIKGLQSSNENEFEYTFRNHGIYNVSMTATAENGCSKTVDKSITIEEDYNLLAPTAFTPNGDFKNDYFIPEALKIIESEFVMTIYGEDGTMVYQTQNVNEPWDGRYTQDNTPAPDGGYVWVVKLRNNKGEFDTYKGQVFITR